MKRPFLYMWTLPLLIVSIAAVGVRAQSTTIGVEPDSIVVTGLGPGSTFTVEIWIRDVEDLAGLEFYLGYDTTVLTATLIEYGDIFGPTYLPLISEINDAEGYLQYAFREALGEPGISGDGRAAIITFEVDSLGSCALDLYDTKLSDPSLPPGLILHEVLDGFFSNEEFHNVAVTNATAYPPEVEVGATVTVNVTVTNKGNYNETFTVTVYADIISYNFTWEPGVGLRDTLVVVGDEITVGTQTVTDLAPDATTTTTFSWNTTGVKAGNYTISAEAISALDDDTTDNLFVPPPLDVPRGTIPVEPPYVLPPYAYSPISVIVTALPAHNIAITNVVPSPTEVTVGENVTINVTVKNEGSFNETFDVTVYYDNTVIDTETDVSLENGTSTTLTFTWDTTDVAEGTYTIKADAILDLDDDPDDNTGEAEDQVTVKEEAAAPNIIIYVAVAAAAIVIIAAAVIYFVKIRK